ncbi:MAG TPA: hypothetical protein V6D29_08465 [Leptolyngbyaceae cyanobacterium]
MQTNDSLTSAFQLVSEAANTPLLSPVEKFTGVVENSPKIDLTAFLDSSGRAERGEAASAFSAVSASSLPEREPVRVMVIGTEHGINSIIHTLYAKGFAHISEWSRLMPHSTGKFMRILTRYVQRP